MSDATLDPSSWPVKLVLRVGKKLRSSKQYSEEAVRRRNERDASKRRQKTDHHVRKLGIAVRRSEDTQHSHQSEVNELGERRYSALTEDSGPSETPKDHTDMLHRLAHHDSFDSLLDQNTESKLEELDHDSKALAKLHRVSTKDERLVACLPDQVWKHVTRFLSPLDAAHLALSSRILLRKLGCEPFKALNRPENIHLKLQLLHSFDRNLPDHLLCFPCATYHARTQPGKESLKIDYVANPIFICANSRNAVLPRLRLTHGRELPYAFVQLALRERRHSSAHGIHHETLSRRWRDKESGWSHRTRYMVHDGRLLMRTVSHCYAPPSIKMTATSERHLLYDREEYTPYFSVCAHWRDGDLMKLCKCALSHIPAPPESYLQQLKKAPKIDRSKARPNFIVTGCDWCRPARRCPECPTEYLFEVQMVEDTLDTVRPFKHALVVTRWSDLGDGSNPYTCPQWTAIKGLNPAGEGEGYQSFSHVGRRAVSGIFESHISGSIPGQRMLSLNPKNTKLGEQGSGWY